MSKVLIVDDEKNILKTLSIGLRRQEYQVINAKSGAEALSIMGHEPCDIIVSDIRMTPMDGYALASVILTKYPEVGIVFMSSYDFREDENQVDRLSDIPKLTKPFTIPELVEVIMQVENKEEDDRVCS